MDEFVWPAMIFTLLAIIITAVITGQNKTQTKPRNQSSAAVDERDPDSAESDRSDKQYCNKTHQQDIRHHCSAKNPKHHSQDSSPDHGDEEMCKSDSTVHSTSRWEEDSSESGITNALKDYAQSPDAESKPLRYMAGMLRSNQLEKMLTKEELEEEQRVQREQLAAIFQLLRDKQDTFGEVTERDLEEQLKLYSI